MENKKDYSDVFGMFCDYKNMSKYFNEFHNLLQNSECDLDSLDISKFLKSLKFLVQNDFLKIDGNKMNNDEIYYALLNIFDSFCLKYFHDDYNCEKRILKTSNLVFLFDSIALLVNIIAPKFKDKISVEYLLHYATDCLNKYPQNQENFPEDDIEKQHFQCLLKLLVKVLQSLEFASSPNQISSEILTPFLRLYPFSNKYALSIFVNHIVPALFSICDHTLKTLILELLWQRIIENFEDNCYTSKESYYTSLLCCFSDYIFKEHFELKGFDVYDDAFWKIVQSGIINENSYSRKQAIYVFKLILFWLKTANSFPSMSPSYSKIPLFTLKTIKDHTIWNDLVTLFETLEEKQSHVIKPVLPKFSRILKQSSKVCSKNSFILHPSWITCFMKRMISHESKYVIKQALCFSMNINFKECHLHNLHSKEFIQVVIEGFRDQNMYCRINENDSSSLFLSSGKIGVFLTNYLAAFETEFEKANFLRYLLKLIASKAWCGVALLHLTFALTTLNSLPSWKSDDIIHVRDIIQGSLKSHEHIVRRAIEYWLLKSCILFIDWKSMCFEKIAELVFIFESMERHTRIWNVVASKLKEIFSEECSDSLSVHKAREFSSYCINKIQATFSGDQRLDKTNLQKMARLLMLLADSSVISCNLEDKCLNWFHLLQPLTSFLMEAPKRPYISEEKFYNVLHFYTFLIDTAVGSIKNVNDDHSSAIISCLNCSIEFLEFLYLKALMDIKESYAVNKFQVLFNALHILSFIGNYNEMFLKLLPNYIIKYDNVPSHFLSKKIIIVLFYEISNSQLNDIKYITKFQSNPLKELSHNLLSKIVNESVINELSKTVFVNEIEKEVWLKIATLSICKFWEVATHTANFLSASDDKDLITALVELAENAFDGGPKATYASAINCVQALIPKLGLSNVHIIEKLLNAAHKACLELHGCDAYRPAIKSFIEAVCQPFLLNEKCFEILYKYLDYFQNLSENYLGIFYLVIKQFCDVFPLKQLHEVKFNYVPFLIYSLTYGPIHHKSQKILEDSVAYIGELDEHFSLELKSYDKPPVYARVTAITYLINNLYKQSSESEEVTIELINALFVFDDSTRTSKSSKFANSYSHRVRNRVWQTILLLQPNLMTKKENEKFLKKVLELLEIENQQPSIRYLQEWIVLKILNCYKCFIEDFILMLENSQDKRPGFLVSLLSILIHLIIHDFMLSESHIHKYFLILINYCMAQNFAVRLCSRLALTKLFLYCEKNNFHELTQKYDFLHDILSGQSKSVLLEKGNIYKNLIKLQEDFYFSVFHPINHFTLETIFLELPRLSNLTSDEWISTEYFKVKINSKFESVIACFNNDDFLKISNISCWTGKSVDETLESQTDSFDYNFQKKICPAKFEIYDCTFDCLNIKNEQKHGDLIVIASLIDKIPNLGGLCRTCEVFGVTQFVIGSLKYSEDKAFQNLAVSSDKWVSIKEVKPLYLKKYLLSLKEEGYILVGAEQTDDSCKLSDYVFPKKCALLLGHEKEGMPIDLIQLLDVCVEIPQKGIIRSLNVHVSGAIFIWEYARQQIKP